MHDQYVRTRRDLHALAELVLAGPRFRRSGRLRLRVLPEGFGTWDEPLVALVGDQLVCEAGRFAVTGSTLAEIAHRAGLQASRLDDVYSGGTDADPQDRVHLDADSTRAVVQALAVGDQALRRFAPTAEPVLWPEHFDVAVTVAEVNYGVSPGDGYSAEPYAYVGPFEPAAGEFWNAPFGAARPLSGLVDAAGTAAFFEAGARHLAG
ncbi:MAG: hypothetical protein WB441_00715 [Nocardioidaceae bacterium]